MDSQVKWKAPTPHRNPENTDEYLYIYIYFKGEKILETIRYLLEYAHMQTHITEALNRRYRGDGDSSDDDGLATDEDSSPEEKPKTPPPMSFKSSPARSPTKSRKSPGVSPGKKSPFHSPKKSPTKSPGRPGNVGGVVVGGGASTASGGVEMPAIDEEAGAEEEEDLQRNYADCWLAKLDEFEILNQQVK